MPPDSFNVPNRGVRDGEPCGPELNEAASSGRCSSVAAAGLRPRPLDGEIAASVAIVPKQMPGFERTDRLALVAHELRNILSPLHLRAICARRSRDPAVIERSLEVIERQVARMSALVNDLLTGSDATVATFTLNSERTCMQTLAEDALECARPLAEAKAQRFTLECARRPLHALLDADRIQQVLANLVGNAVKFTPVGGSVALSVEQEANWGILRVADSGCGMTAITLARAFDLQWQDHESLDAAAGGLGIGLALAKRLVELHGGTLHAESLGPSRGSTFSIRLPLAG